MTPEAMATNIRFIGKQLLGTRQAVAAMQAESRRSWNVDNTRRVEFTSQFGEDVLAWELLGMPTRGFYIEAGAFDGYRYSVTYALETMGWDGILVEPIPKQYAKCASRRPSAQCVHAALSSEPSGAAEFYVTNDRFGGMLSTRHESAAEPHVRERIVVPRTNLNALLSEHNRPIDLVVLDLEGDEMNALAGFDLDRYKPRLLFIEDNDGNNTALETHMSGHGYIYSGQLEVNRIFVRKDEDEIFERLRWMVM